MTIAPPHRERASAPGPVRRAVELVPGLLPLAVVAWGLGPLAVEVAGQQAGQKTGLPAAFVLLCAALYVLQAVLLLRTAPSPNAPSPAGAPGWNPADHVTILRSTLVLPLVALALWPGIGEGARSWIVVATGAVALALDGLDGQVARRTGTSTPFGARFDMELDNLLLVALSLLVWRTDALGPGGAGGAWVLTIGGLRYLFVGAARIWPQLNGELAPSFRRKAICVVQGVVLVACLAPIVPPALATAAAAIALGLLFYSFGVDTAALMRAPR